MQLLKDIAKQHSSKTIPVSHRPNWNDVRIVRAILSLLEAALRDERTTHVLLCTESCVPVATLQETARSVLLDEVCPWEEANGGGDRAGMGKGAGNGSGKGRRIDWDRSYVDCYGRDSSRCTRFDERETNLHRYFLLFCLRSDFAGNCFRRQLLGYPQR